MTMNSIADTEAWVKKLDSRAWKVYSQDGEEGIVEAIFEGLGTPTEAPSPAPRVAVDIGAGDGYNLSNTRFLLERGWRVLMVDGREPASVGIVRAMVTRENVNLIIDRAYGKDDGDRLESVWRVPEDFDFLSLDIDGVDLHVWRALTYRPKVVLVEFNGLHPLSESVTVPYDPAFRHDGTSYYGASLGAMVKLGRLKGYTLVHQQHSVNAFFVRRDLLPPGFSVDVPFEPKRYHPPDTQDRLWEKF